LRLVPGKGFYSCYQPLSFFQKHQGSGGEDVSVPAQKIPALKPELTKNTDVIWDLPSAFKRGMCVPARIITTKKLLDSMDLQVFDQIIKFRADMSGVIPFHAHQWDFTSEG
jgi:hypothetical protein